MFRRRRASRVTVLFGMVAALAAGWLLAASTASSTPTAEVPVVAVTPAAPLTGAVDVTGSPVGGAHGWTAERTQPGRYELTFDADLTVEVVAWDVPATVTLRPREARTWLVDFVEAGTPVDSAFSFTATLE